MCPSLALLVAGVVSAAPPAAGDAKKPTPAEVKKKFYRCWLEVERVEAGVKVTDPDRLAGECFAEGEDWFSWPRRGELAAGDSGRPVRLDPAANPIRVDLRIGSRRNAGGGERGETVVLPCILRFDGERLVLARPRAAIPERALKPGEDYAERPKDFTTTKENGVTVRTLKPCQAYDQD